MPLCSVNIILVPTSLNLKIQHCPDKCRLFRAQRLLTCSLTLNFKLDINISKSRILSGLRKRLRERTIDLQNKRINCTKDMIPPELSRGPWQDSAEAQLTGLFTCSWRCFPKGPRKWSHSAAGAINEGRASAQHCSF